MGTKERHERDRHFTADHVGQQLSGARVRDVQQLDVCTLRQHLGLPRPPSRYANPAHSTAAE